MKKLPLKTFFRDRKRFNFTFSPDLKKLAFISKYKMRTNVFIRDVQTGTEGVVTTQQRRNIHDYSWKGNATILFLQDTDGDENDHLYVVNINTRKTNDLTPWKGVKVISYNPLNKEHFVKGLQKYRDQVMVVHNRRDKAAFDVYLLNIHNRTQKLVASNTAQSNKLVFDAEREKFYYEAITRLGATDYYSLPGPGERKLLFSVSSRDTCDFLALDNSKRHIYYFSNVGRDKVALYKADCTFQTKPKLIFAHKKVDLAALTMNYRSRQLEYVTYYLDKEKRHYFDNTVKARHKQYRNLLYKLFPIEKRSVVQFSNHTFENKLVYITCHADNKLTEEYALDLKTLEIKRLSTPDKDLTPRNLSTVKPIVYKARDGLEIRGYLTMPKARKGPVPVIVNPHGGPWVRDNWGYRAEVQFLANNGYGVFQPNFRISTGYGKKHFVKGWRQWGRACQNDVTDGTKWLVKTGYTKRGMIGIYGASYGGYATLMGIIREPQLYSAAVDFCGVSDLFSFWDGFPAYWKTEGNLFEEAMGNPHKNKKLARAVSPLYHIDKIITPLMVVQGANDPRVPQQQADLIVKKLRAQGRQVEYLLKANEGHGFRNEENKLEFYRQMVRFFDRHLNH